MSHYSETDGYVAVALLAVMALLFVAHPWFLPNSSSGVLLGLPTWYWLELGIMAVLYVLFYAFSARIDAFYALLGVRN